MIEKKKDIADALAANIAQRRRLEIEKKALEQKNAELVEKVKELTEKLEQSEAEKASFARCDHSRIRSLEADNALLRKQLEERRNNPWIP